MYLTKDEVRQKAKKLLDLHPKEGDFAYGGWGKKTTFRKLGFEGIGDREKPDAWFIPYEKINRNAIILFTMDSIEDIHNTIWKDKLFKSVYLLQEYFSTVVGILYNGEKVNVYANYQFFEETDTFKPRDYYFFDMQDNMGHKLSKIERFQDLPLEFYSCLKNQLGIENPIQQLIFGAMTIAAISMGTPFYKGMSLDVLTDSIYKPIERIKTYEWLAPEFVYVYKEFDKLMILLLTKKPDREAINNYIQIILRMSHNFRREGSLGFHIREKMDELSKELKEILKIDVKENNLLSIMLEVPILSCIYDCKYTLEKQRIHVEKYTMHTVQHDIIWMWEEGDNPQIDNSEDPHNINFDPQILTFSLLNLLICETHKSIWQVFGQKKGGFSQGY